MTDPSKMSVRELLEAEAEQWNRLDPYATPLDSDYGDATVKQGEIVNELARRARESDALRADVTAIARVREGLASELDAARATERDLRAKLAAAEQQRDRLAKVAGNAEQGDCLRGELGTVECPVDNQCGVCELTRERDASLERERRLRDALHRISLGSQNSMTSAVALGAEAHFALRQTQPAPARPMPVETFTEAPKPPPAGEPALRELADRKAWNAAGNLWSLMRSAILELARRPR